MTDRPHANCKTDCSIPCCVCNRLFCFECRTEVLAMEPRGGIKSGVFACTEHRALHDKGEWRSTWELTKVAYERKHAALDRALGAWERYLEEHHRRDPHWPPYEQIAAEIAQLRKEFGL